MALMVDLRVTNGDGTDRIETLEIRRLTRLHTGTHRDDQVHQYTATRYGQGWVKMAEAQFEHRYGDGAWWAVLRGLQALADQAAAAHGLRVPGVEMPG